MRLPAGPTARVAGAAARGLALTWRWRWRGPGEGGWRAVRPPVALEPAIYVLWHEHLLPLSVLHRGHGAVALVSEHRDGEILAGVLDGLGYRSARGSSTRGGEGGLRELIRAGRRGIPVALAPDGPRGPARTCKRGVLSVAAATGLPVVPTGAAASPAHRLSSWDRFLVPAPGARVFVSRGPALALDAGPGARPAAEEGVRRRIEEALEAERRRCESAAGLRA